MKVRYKKTGTEASSSRFNLHALGEVLTDDDTAQCRDLDVFIEALGEEGEWKDMLEAFQNHDIINDNYNTRFFEPTTAEDRARGYTLE